MRASSIWQRSVWTSYGRLIGGLLGLLVLALVAAGCAGNSAASNAQATAAPVAQPTTAPATAESAASQVAATTGVSTTVGTSGATTNTVTTTVGTSGAAAGQPALVNLAQKANFGLFLVDDKGMTLYEYTKDTGNSSTCYEQCAANWPPLLTIGAPQAGPGVTGSLLGTTTRTDGKTQVTFNGHPLYYFVKDQKPGDINGQGVGGVWFVLSPRGGGMTQSKAPGAGTPQAFNVVKPEPTPSGPATLDVSQTGQMGQFLVDDRGMSLYMFTKDAPNTSNCYDLCAVTWPPLLSNGKPAAGAGVDASLLGTITRKDGSVQVTYKGLPLYYFLRDQKSGDTNGQGVGGTWFVISPQGEMITAGARPTSAAPAATSAPAATPAGGGYGAGGG